MVRAPKLLVLLLRMMASQCSNKAIADAQITDFLFFSPVQVDIQERTDVKLLREKDFEDFSCFHNATQEILHTVPKQPQALILVISSDTLNEARKYQGNGDFISGLGLDLRAPQLESYHSAFHGTGVDRVFNIRFSAGTANQPDSRNYIPCQLQPSERRSNLVYYRYEIGNKRSICLFSERQVASSFTIPERDRETVESIRRFEKLSETRSFFLHPFWSHFVLLYHVIDTRNKPLDNSFHKLLAIESQLLDGTLIKTRPADGFGQQVQDLHEILRALITLEHSNEHDYSLIGKILLDLDLLSQECSSLGAKFAFDAETESRIKSAFLCLQHLCEDRKRRCKNRKQRAQNLVELLYNLTATRDSLTSLEIARKNADIARDTRRDSESMYAISIVTMLYLPASLVCSFFGTNFFALEAKSDGRLTFLVSDRCWIYGLSTVLLTTFTFSVWLAWQRRMKSNEQAIGNVQRTK